ncbi:MAG: PHP domain-containing protein, partial [Ignavibacteria bacterium]|nr:PHP domain-containing protein [Ignavibacteria bacterium]
MISRKIDLHIHTTHSDGTYSPAQIAAKLVQLGIGTFSFTDHDTISSLAEAEEICMAHGLHCLPGVEFTTYIDDKEVHILGYGFDRTNPAVNRLLAYFFDERLSRAKRILQKLEAYHKPLTIEEVQAEAKNAAIARPHIAMAMIKKGYVRHFYEAFDLYLGNNGVCYERKFFIEPQVIFNVI